MREVALSEQMRNKRLINIYNIINCLEEYANDKNHG